MFLLHILFALDGVLAGPVAQKQHVEKRQDTFGVIPGVPAGLSGMIMPLISSTGLLPTIVKTGINSGYGKVADVPGAAPKKVVMQSRNPHIADSKTMKIRYGPYKVPASTRKNFVGESGTLFNYPELDVPRPCQGECVLLSMEADLEYADGSNANTANGMWLHHMVLFNVGPNRFDPTCVGKTSLPHLLISSDPGHSERVMASGNERTRTRFNSPYQPGEKLGYYLNPNDKFALILDFMNEKPEERVVYLTMTYDYVEGRPAGFSNFRIIWLDVAQCGTSEVRPPQESGQYKVAQTWTANLDGDILGAGGHLHDGGTHLTIDVDGKQICDSAASYGVTTGNASAGGGGMMGGGMKKLARRDGPGHGISGAAHITNMTVCAGKTMGLAKLQKGQKWTITGYYDYDKHGGMKSSGGKQSNVMGIAVMMIKNWSA